MSSETDRPRSIKRTRSRIRARPLRLARRYSATGSLASAIGNASTGNIIGLGKNVIDLASHVQFEDLSPEERAWLLICRSVERALSKLISDIGIEAFDVSLSVEEMCSLADIEEAQIYIDNSLFENPKDSTVIHTLEPYIEEWLKDLGMPEERATSLLNRFESYFVRALHSEWSEKRNDYSTLSQFFTGPFFEATEREFYWQTYNTILKEKIYEPIFGETFGIAELYVPLRGYFEEVSENISTSVVDDDFESTNKTRIRSKSESTKNVVDVESAIVKWLQNDDADDNLRVICGGPGSGKSTLIRMFAVRVSSDEFAYQPIVIPLHQFEYSSNVSEQVQKFCQETGIVRHNPLDAYNGEKKILLLLDGLDELAMQGHAAKEGAQEFVQEVQRTIERTNLKENRLKVIIGGRELVIQANQSLARVPQQIIHLLPYYISDFLRENRPGIHRCLFRPSIKISPELTKDQRHQWWRQYGKLTGKNYECLPSELDRADLLDVTKQPLLNYLLALSYQRGQVDFESEGNVNHIYHDLLAAVHERGWADKRNPAVVGLSFPAFVRVLEEVALAAWHGDGRTASVREIEGHFDKCGCVAASGPFSNLGCP